MSPAPYTLLNSTAASPVTLLYQPFQAIIDTLVLDCSVKEEHTAEVEVTDHAVEQGSAITDHARPKPEELTIEGIVSNTPLSSFQVTRAVNQQGVTLQTTSQANNARGMPGAAELAYTQLRSLRDSGKLVTIVTQLRTYDNMAMTSLKVPREDKIGDVLKFECKFKQVRIVTNAVTVVATKVNKTKPPQVITNGSGIAPPKPIPGTPIKVQNWVNNRTVTGGKTPPVPPPTPSNPSGIPGSGF